MRLIIDTVKLWRCFSRLRFLILAVMLLVLSDCTAQSVQQSPNKTLQGNGDPASLVFFVSTEKEAYFGLLFAIVRSQKTKPGAIRIIASSPGIRPASVEIKSK